MNNTLKSKTIIFKQKGLNQLLIKDKITLPHNHHGKVFLNFF